MKLELSTLFRRQVTFKTAKSNMGKRLQIKKKKTLLYPYLQTLWSNSCAVGCALKEKVGQGGLAVTPFRRVTTPWNTLPPPSISPNQSLSLKLFIFKINKQKSDYFLELVMISLPVPVALTRGPIKWFHFFFFWGWEWEKNKDSHGLLSIVCKHCVCKHKLSVLYCFSHFSN